MFIGVPVVTQVADDLVRITGVGLIEGTSGTIGLFQAAPPPDIRLPEGFKARAYSRPGPDVTLQDNVKVDWESSSMNGLDNLAVNIVKTGTTPVDFLITMSANGGGETNTGPLEIYVRYH